MNKHVPAFQLEASVRCHVNGTDAEVKASREKTVNTWLTAGIPKSWREKQERSAQKLGGDPESGAYTICWLWMECRWLRCSI